MQGTLTHPAMAHMSAAALQRPLQQQRLVRPCGGAALPFTASRRPACARQQLVVVRAQTDSQEPTTSQQPATPPPSSKPEDEPIWIRRERERELQAKEGKDLPFGAYLLFSAMVAIASVGSVFEYFDRNALFDVVQPDNPLWAPILFVFIFTGFPMAGFLFYKAVSAANKASEQMDKLDGY